MRNPSPLLLLMGALALFIAACGSGTDSDVPPVAETTTSPIPTSTVTQTPSATAEEPAVEPSPEPTQQPTAEPTTPPPPPTPDATQTPDNPSGQIIRVELAGGSPVSGVERHRVSVGETVTIEVSGDSADELHIHGYDLVVGFTPDQKGTITFEANIPGIFEVESHHQDDLVMELEVR